MPKKTREEKILARLRRLEQSKNLIKETQVEKSQEINQTISLDLETSKNKNSSQPTSTEVIDYSFVAKDLRKTVIFIVAAVAFEIGLSIVFTRFDIPFINSF